MRGGITNTRVFYNISHGQGHQMLHIWEHNIYITIPGTVLMFVGLSSVYLLCDFFYLQKTRPKLYIVLLFCVFDRHDFRGFNKKMVSFTVM